MRLTFYRYRHKYLPRSDSSYSFVHLLIPNIHLCFPLPTLFTCGNNSELLTSLWNFNYYLTLHNIKFRKVGVIGSDLFYRSWQLRQPPQLFTWIWDRNLYGTTFRRHAKLNQTLLAIGGFNWKTFINLGSKYWNVLRTE